MKLNGKALWIMQKQCYTFHHASRSCKPSPTWHRQSPSSRHRHSVWEVTRKSINICTQPQPTGQGNRSANAFQFILACHWLKMNSVHTPIHGAHEERPRCLKMIFFLPWFGYNTGTANIFFNISTTQFSNIFLKIKPSLLYNDTIRLLISNIVPNDKLSPGMVDVFPDRAVLNPWNHRKLISR